MEENKNIITITNNGKPLTNNDLLNELSRAEKILNVIGNGVDKVNFYIDTVQEIFTASYNVLRNAVLSGEKIEMPLLELAEKTDYEKVFGKSEKINPADLYNDKVCVNCGDANAKKYYEIPYININKEKEQELYASNYICEECARKFSMIDVLANIYELIPEVDFSVKM